MEWLTLNVIILNNETFPPQADITYESFFDSAIHGTDSSRLTPETSLAIRRPLFGCQCWGTTLAVAFKHTDFRNLFQERKISSRNTQNIKEEKLSEHALNQQLPFHLDFVRSVSISTASEHHLTQVPKPQCQNLYTEVEQPKYKHRTECIIKYINFIIKSQI